MKYISAIMNVNAKYFMQIGLRNWRWQWFYENRELLPRKDYDDICKLNDELPDSLRDQYKQDILIWQDKILAVLQM